MADIQSNLVTKRARHRGIYSGKPYEVAGRFFFAEGTELTTEDVLLAVPVGENQVVKEVYVTVVGDLGAAAASIGYFQILDGAGDPVVVQRRGPRGEDDEMFESPESDPDAYASAAALTGYERTPVDNVVKLPGPVNVGAAITTAGTVAEDTEVFIGVQFDGETSTREVTDPYGYANDYLLNPGA